MQRYIELDGLKRVMAVVKVRASAHSNKPRVFDIDHPGIKKGEALHGYDGLLSGAPTQRLL